MKIMLILFCLLPIWLVAQHSMYNDNDTKVELGVGAGLDYGGIGVRFTGTPSPYFGFFGGLGFAFAGVGFNGGLNLVVNPGSRVEGYLTGMYGYNAAVKYTDEDKLYYGPTFGLGAKINLNNAVNYINVEVLAPIRNQEYKDRHDDDLPPVAISLGFHWKF